MRRFHWKGVMKEDFDLNNFIAIDCEYVSLSNRFYAWQIGIHKFVNGHMVTKWTSYVRPPQKAFEILNTKKQAILKDAPPFETVMEDIEKFIADTKLVVVYGISDKRVIEKEFNRLGKKIPHSYWIDLYIFCANVYGQNFNLEQSCERVQISHFLAHDAEADSLATGHLFARLMECLKFKSGKELFAGSNCNLIDEKNERLYNKIIYKKSYVHHIPSDHERIIVGGEGDDKLIDDFDANKLKELTGKKVRFVGNFKTEKFGQNRQKVFCLKHGIHYSNSDKDKADIIVYSSSIDDNDKKYILERKKSNVHLYNFWKFHRKFSNDRTRLQTVRLYSYQVMTMGNRVYKNAVYHLKRKFMTTFDRIFISPKLIVEEK